MNRICPLPARSGSEPAQSSKFLKRRTVCPQTVNGGAFIHIAKPHAAEKHQLFRHGEKLADGLVPDRPGFLRRGVEAVFARNQHDRLHEKAEIDPLAKTHLAVNGEENRNRRIEEAEVLCKL